MSLVNAVFGVSTGYTDGQGRYNPCFQEHFFLPDPDTLIYTHFPYHTSEASYYR